MDKNKFEQLHGHQGGIAKLEEFRSLLSPLSEIADHFGVVKERVRQWMREFYGGYDPRKLRRERKIYEAKKLIIKVGYKQARKELPTINDENFKEALKQANDTIR